MSILCQLQRLFGRLQLSVQSSVHSSGLTSAFGWRGDDVYTQHDVQELQHVMYDALQQQYGDTALGSFLATHCHGSMVDYVECQTCHTRRERVDQFMDLSLVVKGIYTLQDSLQQFIKPDVLQGKRKQKGKSQRNTSTNENRTERNGNGNGKRKRKRRRNIPCALRRYRTPFLIVDVEWYHFVMCLVVCSNVVS